ncbi:hypothetical protein Zmor_028087 [Zophobas morio]|uniref:Uncharacterized protein n=1 Tax=Zophobas morio TaxID=2755281 RepID=A0AA38M2L7_9CUCU|nr:hypothetical protein Zmor_028087 [Zophobas morio]
MTPAQILLLALSIQPSHPFSPQLFINSTPPLLPCLTKISEKFLIKKESIWLTTNEQNTTDLFDNQFVKKLMRRGHSISVKMMDLKETPQKNFWQHTKNYIIETSDVADLEATLENFKYLHSWNSQARFFIIANQIYNETERVLSGMVETLWLEGVYDFILITADRNQSRHVNVYTWYPYRCRRGFDYARLKLLDVCCNGSFTNNSNLFPQKIPKVLTACELKVGAVTWPPFVMKPVARVDNTDQYIIKEGVEIRLIETIVTKLRMNVSYIMSEKSQNWGHLFDNGTGTGLMALLRNKRVDLGIASITPSLSKSKFFELSDTYFFESFAWCVPHAPTQAGWKKILDAISYQLWIGYVLSFITFGILIWLLGKTRKEETLYKKCIYCFQNSFSMALGVSVRHHPKTQILRWITFFWILFSLNFEVLYETKLMSILTKPTYSTQVNSIDDILDKNYKILFPLNIFNYVDKNASFDASVFDRSDDCLEVKDCLARVAYLKDSALCLSSSYTHYIKESYATRDNIPLIYCFNSKLATYPVILLMKKGFPLALRFNNIISRLVEGGFIDHWAADINTQKWKEEEMQKLNTTTNTEFLDLGKLQGAFIVLLIGLAIATTVFVLEIIHFLFFFLKGKHIFIV